MSEDADHYRVKRALREWTRLWRDHYDTALAVEAAILRRDDQAAEGLLAGSVHDPKILIEHLRPEIEREDKVERLVPELTRMEARILRRVATALSGRAHTAAYRSMGGPQDGDSHPAEFDGAVAAEDLEREAREIEDAALAEVEARDKRGTTRRAECTVRDGECVLRSGDEPGKYGACVFCGRTVQ